MRTLGQGEVLRVPAGSPHSDWSQTGGRVNWQTRPAGKTEAFFELVWGLARDGKVKQNGRPNLLQSAVLARAYRKEWRLARPPYGIQLVLFGVLAPIRRLLVERSAGRARPAVDIHATLDGGEVDLHGRCVRCMDSAGDRRGVYRVVLTAEHEGRARPDGQAAPDGHWAVAEADGAVGNDHSVIGAGRQVTGAGCR